jgi:menaquinone-dependent protoporphyrinogen oxidase
MKALVTVSSKHGGTEEIGRSIADTLRGGGLEVDLVAPERVTTLDGYDAVIVGSALYLGRWMGPARDLVRREAEALRARSVWLFASGPVTGVEEDAADRAEGMRLLELVGGREFRLFAGLLDRSRLGIVERTIVRAIGSPWGDHRPWEEIEDWATSIAAAMKATEATVPAR